MSSLLKHKSGIYYVVYFVNGKRIWRSLRTRNLQSAQNLFSARKDEFKSPATKPAEPTPGNVTLQQAVIEYLSYVQTNFSTATFKDYTSVTKVVSKYFGPQTLVCDISNRSIEKYKEQKHRPGLSPHTVNHDLRCLKAFFNRLILWEIIEKNPCKGVKQIRVDETIRPYLSKTDLSALMEHTKGTFLYDIILFAVSTGMRIGEIVNLTWDVVDLCQKKIVVKNGTGFRTKSGKIRVVPINSTVEKILEGSPNREGYVFKYNGEQIRVLFLSKKFKAAIRACKLDEKLHFHSLRHTCGSYLVEQGVSLYHVQQLLGHSSPMVTQIYAHLGASQLLSSVEKIKIDVE